MPRMRASAAARPVIVGQLSSLLPSLTRINSRDTSLLPSVAVTRRTSSGSVAWLLKTGTMTAIPQLRSIVGPNDDSDMTELMARAPVSAGHMDGTVAVGVGARSDSDDLHFGLAR